MVNYGQGGPSGKIILMGEHAVVYGELAIAFPFCAAKVTVFLEELNVMDDQLISSYYSGNLAEAPHILKNIKKPFIHLKKEHDIHKNLQLTIESMIPVERGMGLSAAVVTAVTRAFYDYLAFPLSRKILLENVQLSEKIAHGNPSGVDVTTTSSSQPTYLTKEHPLDYLSLNTDALLIIADTGIKGQTREVVKDVAYLSERQPYETEQMIQKLGYLTKQAKQVIIESSPGMLVQTMDESQSLLEKLTISSDLLDLLVQIAKDTGTLGAKLTDGGRGGCMIALTQTKTKAREISQALEDVGATETWIQGLGVHIYV